MPTYEARARFLREWDRLSAEQKAAFGLVVLRFVGGLRTGRHDPRLRIKRVQGEPGVWEISWAPDGRATFEYGPEQRAGDPHIVWRRIGTHAILRQP